MNNIIFKIVWPLLLMLNIVPLVMAASLATVLDTGAGITCGILNNGQLACSGWGHAKKPEIINSLSKNTFSQVSVGYNYGCAVRSDDNTLACWGHNLYGQATPPSGTFSQVSTAVFHSCGLHTNGTIECWGGSTDAPDYGQTKPPTEIFSQVSVGRWHTCGLKTDQTVSCWGNNLYGQATPPEGTFSQISAARFGWHTCGIRADQTITCWGLNDNGQATPPEGLFLQVSTGKWHTCGIRSVDQSIICWGNNGDGEAEAPNGRFSYVSAGVFHTCAIQTDNVPLCWGYDIWGSVKSISENTLPVVLNK